MFIKMWQSSITHAAMQSRNLYITVRSICKQYYFFIFNKKYTTYGHTHYAFAHNLVI